MLVGRISALLGYWTNALGFLAAVDLRLHSVPRWFLAKSHPQFFGTWVSTHGPWLYQTQQGSPSVTVYNTMSHNLGNDIPSPLPRSFGRKQVTGAAHTQKGMTQV